MSLKKTEQIIYSINKKIHSRQLSQMKPAIDSTPPHTFHKLPKPYQLIPYNRRYQIRTDNKQMINKILSIAKQENSPKERSVSRPIRGNSLEKWQICQDNQGLYERLRKAKPAIGSIEIWNREYSRSTCARGRQSISKKISHSSSKMALSTEKLEENSYRKRIATQINEQVRKIVLSKRLFKLKLPSFQHVKTEGDIQNEGIEEPTLG